MGKRRKNEQLEDIISQLNFRQRILAKIFRKDFEKIYHAIRLDIINNLL